MECTVVYLGHAKFFLLEKIMLCARHNISYARNIFSCARLIISFAQHIMSCARQREIVAILQSQFGINVSERHLRRILCKLNLPRAEHSDIVYVATFVSSQLETSVATKQSNNISHKTVNIFLQHSNFSFTYQHLILWAARLRPKKY